MRTNTCPQFLALARRDGRAAHLLYDSPIATPAHEITAYNVPRSTIRRSGSWPAGVKIQIGEVQAVLPFAG